jgi:hypothetical protein
MTSQPINGYNPGHRRVQKRAGTSPAIREACFAVPG